MPKTIMDSLKLTIVWFGAVLLYSVLIVMQAIRCCFVNVKKMISEEPECLHNPSFGNHGHIHLKHRANGFKIHYVSKGEKGKPLILLLHGFPEFWYSWRYQLKAFGEDVFMVAMDLPGYGESNHPTHKEFYEKHLIAEDVKEFVLEMGYTSCVLVGHDWGGIIAFDVVYDYPEIVDKLVIVNSIHLRSLSGASLKQYWALKYIHMFQLPCIAEWFLSTNDIFKTMQRFARHNYTEEDSLAYKYFFQKGGFTRPLNYYRMLTGSYTSGKKVKSPMLIIWGASDRILQQELARSMLNFTENGRLELIDDSSHSPQYEQPDAFNKLLEEFIGCK